MWLYAVVLMANDGKNYQVGNLSADRDKQVASVDVLNLNKQGLVYDTRVLWFEK